jgi:hypothetical protein
MLRSMARVKIGDSEESIVSIIRVTWIYEKGRTLAVTNNRNHAAKKRRFWQEPQSVTCQKTAFFVVHPVTLEFRTMDIFQKQ